MKISLRTKLRRALRRRKIAAQKKSGMRRMELVGGYKYQGELVEYKRAEAGAASIKACLGQDSPAMVARLGSIELTFLDRWKFHYSTTEYRASALRDLCNNAGFFPPKPELSPDFVEEFLSAAHQMDVFCAWNFRNGLWDAEEMVFGGCNKKPVLIDIAAINQFVTSQNPWTQALAGKRVLVISPFAKSIETQYLKRKKLFQDASNRLPRFKSLSVLKAVQSIAYSDTGFTTWFEALESMKQQMEEVEFDIALIGAGAYGLPLAAHAKLLKRKGVHMGGMTQILFGVYGARWEHKYNHIINSDWVRPLPEETPGGFKRVEEGCYW